MIEKRRIRILQVVPAVGFGGVEEYLRQTLRHLNRKKYQMDFLVQFTPIDSQKKQEIEAYGSKVLPCYRHSVTFPYKFKKILREQGPYDIIHSHGIYFNGYILRLAHQTGLPIRIAHCHISNTPWLEARASFRRRLYFGLMKRWITRYATHGLGVSTEAMALFSLDRQADPRWHILYCTLDLSPFHQKVEPAAVRAELDIPADAFVIGHVGTFSERKNHKFILEIAAAVARLEPNVYLLLIGEGPLRPAIELQAQQAGLSKQVIFTGFRNDVPRLMLGAMDTFLFPSHYEGLALCLIEAQAAGLPCIISDVQTEEGDIVKSLVQRLSLSQPASAWAEVLAASKVRAPFSRSEALEIVECSPFNSRNKTLERFYDTITETLY